MMSESLNIKINSNQAYIVLYDGQCMLCSNLMRFIRSRKGAYKLAFISLSSSQGQALVNSQLMLSERNSDTAFFIEHGIIYSKSDAILRILLHLGSLWYLLYSLHYIPRGLRNKMYDFIARHRHLWSKGNLSCPWNPR